MQKLDIQTSKLFSLAIKIVDIKNMVLSINYVL